MQVLSQSAGGSLTDAYTYGVQRLAHETAAGDAEYLYDGFGSVAQVLAVSSVADTLRYDPYGNVLPGGDSFVPFFGYNGEEHCLETGLQYLRAVLRARPCRLYHAGHNWRRAGRPPDPKPVPVHHWRPGKLCRPQWPCQDTKHGQENHQYHSG